MYGEAEDEDGKESINYLHKKLFELRLAKGGQQKPLVSEAEELIQLAHKTHFHQLSVYPEMLNRLAAFANRLGNKPILLRVCSEMLTTSSSNQECWIEWYFDSVRYLLGYGEFTRVEEFVGSIEAWPEERFAKQHERIRTR